MSSGKEHDRACLKLSAIALIGAIAAPTPEWEIFLTCAAGGSALCLVLNPDLDLKGNARRRWGKVGLGWVWALYDALIPHRSFWSHGPIIGTFGRIFYLSVVFASSVYSMRYIAPFLPFFTFPWPPETIVSTVIEWVRMQPPERVWGIISGLSAGDILHSVMDAASSADKRRKYRSDR